MKKPVVVFGLLAVGALCVFRKRQQKVDSLVVYDGDQQFHVVLIYTDGSESKPIYMAWNQFDNWVIQNGYQDLKVEHNTIYK